MSLGKLHFRAAVNQGVNLSSRITRGSVNGTKFEHFDPFWNKTYDKFTDFCEQITRKFQLDLKLHFANRQ
jgi:hypothetical protein